jgi:2-polyprenyl-3-methyl-5-hydroxy-6-metoxy-1,4-benzoquinol methylase
MSISMPVKKAKEFMRMYDVQSILEVGCGKGGIISQFCVDVRVGIDNYRPYLNEGKALHPGVIFIRSNITELMDMFISPSFEAVIGFDILEHLPEDKMFAQIQVCESLAQKLVVFFSPLDEPGLKMQPADVEENPGMRHITIIRERYFIERKYQTFIFPDYHYGVDAILAVKEM